MGIYEFDKIFLLYLLGEKEENCKNIKKENIS